MSKKINNKKGYIGVEHIIVGAIVILLGFTVFSLAREDFLQITNGQLGILNTDN